MLTGYKKFSGRTKHIAPKYQLLRELAKDGSINVCYKSTTNMIADVGTKYLEKQAFENVLRQIIRNF